MQRFNEPYFQGLSIRLCVLCASVCPSNAWIVTKRKQLVPTFLYHMKDHSPCFLTRRMVGGRDHFFTWNFGAN